MVRKPTILRENQAALTKIKLPAEGGQLRGFLLERINGESRETLRKTKSW